MDVGGSAHNDRRYFDARGDNLMTSRQYLVSFLLFGFLSFAIQGQGYADELKIFTSRAVAVLEKIGPESEKGTGHKLNLTTGLSSEFVGRINAGEPFDVVAAPPPVLDSLANSGKIAAESKTGLVRSANGVAIRTGAPKPDVSSLENFKRALLDAKSIRYLPVPGVPQLIERLGLKEAPADHNPENRSLVRTRGQGRGRAGHCPCHSSVHHPGCRARGTSAVGDSVLHRVRWRDQRQLKVARRRSGVA